MAHLFSLPRIIKGCSFLIMFLFATTANAALPVLDSFDKPAIPKSRVSFGAVDANSNSFYFNDFTNSVPGGIRGTAFRVFQDPLNSISALSIGKGRLSVAKGTGVQAEATLSYGYSASPQPGVLVPGPALGLDLTGYSGLQFDFSGMEHACVVIVSFRTTAPLDPANPQWYSVNYNLDAPPLAAPGAPWSFVVKMNNDPGFNWAQVDGIQIIIDRPAGNPHSSFTLDKLTFVSQ